jgi:hypothetical protein
MVALHTRLCAGDSPAVALATLDEAAASFVCYGAGWSSSS